MFCCCCFFWWGLFFVLFCFLHTKWTQNGFSKVRPRSYGGVGLGSKSQNFNLTGPLIGGPHPPKINHGYGPGGSERLQLAISTAAIFKGGVNREWNGPLFVCLFFCRLIFCFCFVCVCLFVFNHLKRALNWYQK